MGYEFYEFTFKGKPFLLRKGLQIDSITAMEPFKDDKSSVISCEGVRYGCDQSVAELKEILFNSFNSEGSVK